MSLYLVFYRNFIPDASMSLRSLNSDKMKEKSANMTQMDSNIYLQYFIFNKPLGEIFQTLNKTLNANTYVLPLFIKLMLRWSLKAVFESIILQEFPSLLEEQNLYCTGFSLLTSRCELQYMNIKLKGQKSGKKIL